MTEARIESIYGELKELSVDAEGHHSRILERLCELDGMSISARTLGETMIPKKLKGLQKLWAGKLKSKALKLRAKWKKIFRGGEENDDSKNIGRYFIKVDRVGRSNKKSLQLTSPATLKLGGLWGKSLITYKGQTYKLSVLKSLMQKALRQNHRSFSLSVKIIVEATKSYMQENRNLEKKDLTKVKSILTNVVNRLLVMGVEEGSLLMLVEEDRAKLVKAFKRAKGLSIKKISWSLLEPLCSLLERCGPIHCRVVSYVWALTRIISRFKTHPKHVAAALVQCKASSSLVSRLRTLAQETRLPEFNEFLEGRAHSLAGLVSRSIRDFINIVPKNAEFGKRKMQFTGARLALRFKHVFGAQHMLPPSPGDTHDDDKEDNLPTQEELQEMGVIDRHCGGKRSKHFFAVKGARTPHLLKHIRETILTFSERARFTLDELETVYIAEKLSFEVEPEAESGEKENVNEETLHEKERGFDGKHMEVEKYQGRGEDKNEKRQDIISTEAFQQLGFKGWTLRVDTKMVRGHNAQFDEHILDKLDSSLPLFFLRHETNKELKTLHEILREMVSIPKLQTVVSLSRKEWEPINSFLQCHALASSRYKDKVLKSTSNHTNRSESHYIFLQEFISQMTKFSKLPDKLLQSRGPLIGKQLLEHCVVNYLLPLTDFNGTNLGFDSASGMTIRYDLMIENNISKGLNTRKRKGFATAQGWSKRFRDLIGKAILKNETLVLETCERVFKVLEARADKDDSSCPLSSRFLSFARSTELGKMFEKNRSTEQRDVAVKAANDCAGTLLKRMSS